MILGADLNSHVGSTSEGYEMIHGGKGYGTRNEEGERMPEMTESLELFFVNTGFPKRLEHLVIYKSGVAGHRLTISWYVAKTESK